MLQIPFSKYQGTGNDFVVIDQRTTQWISLNDHATIQRLCDRKFGIGADGLMLLQNKAGYDFEMVYFNADGYQSSMCGNGGRCIVAFAQQLGVFESECRFWAIDGVHDAKVLANGEVKLKMNDVSDITVGDDYFELNTGSPHYVIFVEDIDDLDIQELGSTIRYSKPYREKGINVNFVERSPQGLLVATYERGVEAETLSCGTGVTAAALSYATSLQNTLQKVVIETKGGRLQVEFEYDTSQQQYHNIWLVGAATEVFTGRVTHSLRPSPPLTD